MKNCLISLDVVWVKEDGTVVETSENTPPCSPLRGDDCPTYGGTVPARHFVEFPAGTLRRIGLKKGDRLGWNLTLPTAPRWWGRHRAGGAKGTKNPRCPLRCRVRLSGRACRGGSTPRQPSFQARFMAKVRARYRAQNGRKKRSRRITSRESRTRTPRVVQWTAKGWWDRFLKLGKRTLETISSPTRNSSAANR